MHDKVDHSNEHIAERMVHAMSRLQKMAMLGHMGGEPINAKGLGATRNADT
jgi:hypothetical protein